MLGKMSEINTCLIAIRSLVLLGTGRRIRRFPQLKFVLPK